MKTQWVFIVAASAAPFKGQFPVKDTGEDGFTGIASRNRFTGDFVEAFCRFLVFGVQRESYGRAEEGADFLRESEARLGNDFRGRVRIGGRVLARETQGRVKKSLARPNGRIRQWQ